MNPPSLLHRRIALVKPPLVDPISDSSFHNHSPSSLVQDQVVKKPKKSVRFRDNSSLENVRLFLKSQMPIACRSDPKGDKRYHTCKLRRVNWPLFNYASNAAVCMEDVSLIVKHQQQQPNMMMFYGTCKVANIAFKKNIVIHYTINDWKTVQRVDATYMESVANSANTWDRFKFNIALKKSTTHHAYLQLAVQYTVSDHEFWDNNDGQNYQFDIVPTVQLVPHNHHSSLNNNSSSSSSSSSEEDNNTFDISSDEDEQELMHLTKKKLCLKDNAAAIAAVPSPPLSPTTPTDGEPTLYMNSSSISAKEYFPTTGANNKKQDKQHDHGLHGYLFKKYMNPLY